MVTARRKECCNLHFHDVPGRHQDPSIFDIVQNVVMLQYDTTLKVGVAFITGRHGVRNRMGGPKFPIKCALDHRRRPGTQKIGDVDRNGHSRNSEVILPFHRSVGGSGVHCIVKIVKLLRWPLESGG